MADYSTLMSAIIKKEMSIVGKEFALKVARNVPDVEVDDEGNVSGGNKARLHMLVEEYRRVSGGLAVIFARKAIQPFLSGGEDLPEELKG